ncbi:hypothetical protein AWB75_05674 [Caballeronia catudaia]|uniref:Uncharacterized protein n=1 Tax=Caballeronia catudaia TaxID=1777136 RepID=A0A158CSJ4_9BURK|nr:DUF2255 family protein [Caballeronia catudaia]SAK85345.1 hypothetical protein AWB75_05674 [Caballeronia catudaia]
MGMWTRSELERIAASDDLYIAPFREDHKTYGTPTWIWSVIVDGHLYVRAYNGEASRGYQAAIRQGAGRITVAGTTRDVLFAGARGAINDKIDEAYRLKYGKSPSLAPMIDERVRVTTIDILPAD